MQSGGSQCRWPKPHNKWKENYLWSIYKVYLENTFLQNIAYLSIWVEQKLDIKTLTDLKISRFNSKVKKRDSYLISTNVVKK